MRIKKNVIWIIFFLMVSVVIAEEFKITLVSYNSEERSAQIRIENTGNQDYSDLTMSIDNLEPKHIVGLISPGGAIKLPRGVPPGKHTITISTAEGVTVSKELDFPRSELQVKKELEGKQSEEVEKKTVREETQLKVYEKGKGSKIGLLALLGLLILVLYFVFKKIKEKQKPLSRTR